MVPVHSFRFDNNNNNKETRIRSRGLDLSLSAIMSNYVGLILNPCDDAVIKKQDRPCRNKWKWSWLEKSDFNGDHIGDYLAKINNPGYAICKWCNLGRGKLMNYGEGGLGVITQHAKTGKHKKASSVNKSVPRVIDVLDDVVALESGIQPERVHEVPYGVPSRLEPYINQETVGKFIVCVIKVVMF